MRRAGRTDANQEEVVKALRQSAIAVKVLSSVGGGMPDLLCGFRGVNVLLEVKDGNKTPSERKLTADEAEFHSTWAGQVAVVNSGEEAVLEVLRVVGL
jgi:hypothetical protein